ncbi:MAG: H-NS family nucleoid-associated regulatory protein [Halothiobacillaceae bacterium]
MSQVDLSQMSADELKELMEQAENSLRERHQRRIMELRKEAEELAREMGMAVGEVFGVDGGRGPAQKSKLPPKFMNPNNPKQTWTGRGKRPRWLAEALERGEPEDKFRI